MRCTARGFDEPRCKREATIAVPVGYGRDDMMCLWHAERWGDSQRSHHLRRVGFYALLAESKSEANTGTQP